MTYLVVCTFDLKSATQQDYSDAYARLERIGLKKVIIGEAGQRVVAPTTTTAGEFNGQSATQVRDSVLGQVRAAFAARFSSEIFVVVGGDWAWGANTT